MAALLVSEGEGNVPADIHGVVQDASDAQNVVPHTAEQDQVAARPIRAT